MAVHEILLESLEDLDSEEMNLFKWHLSQGINNYKIPKSQLEKKQRFEIVTCMIQHYQPDGAGKLTLLVLEKMKQMNLAKELREKLGAEFVEKRRRELVSRVSLVEPIADDLKSLIGDEKYHIILNQGTRHAQMRKLLDFLTTPKLKEEFYQSLLKHERLLVEDLEGSS